MDIDIGEWGLSRRDQRLWLDGHDLTGLAEKFGTPVHVVSASRLRARATEVLNAFSQYPGSAHIHFSYKTNPVAGVLRVLHDAGLGAEVVNGYELHLARRLGVPGDRIVFNGPNKTDAELRAAIDAGVGLLVVDHLEELTRVQSLARQSEQRVRIGLRVCPDISPRHMNASSLTGSRRNQFGLDLPGDEYNAALRRVAGSEELELRGVMAHIGSGIHDLKSFERAVQTLLDLHLAAFDAGCTPDRIDIGGGLGTRLSRELSTFELLAYLGAARLPKLGRPGPADLWARYAEAVCGAMVDGCERRGIALPDLVLEPGRAMVSDAQVLLLSVGAVRERPGVGHFALTDGGAMTVSMMFLSEMHAVLLANRIGRGKQRVNVFGALPSPMDVVYRNLDLPPLRTGDVLAVMDAGAYFTATSTNFGGPRPGVLLIDGDEVRWTRRPETYDDLLAAELDA